MLQVLKTIDKLKQNNALLAQLQQENAQLQQEIAQLRQENARIQEHCNFLHLSDLDVIKQFMTPIEQKPIIIIKVNTQRSAVEEGVVEESKGITEESVVNKPEVLPKEDPMNDWWEEMDMPPNIPPPPPQRDCCITPPIQR